MDAAFFFQKKVFLTPQEENDKLTLLFYFFTAYNLDKFDANWPLTFVCVAFLFADIYIKLIVVVHILFILHNSSIIISLVGIVPSLHRKHVEHNILKVSPRNL